MAEQQRIVKLRSATGETFEVDEAVASQSQLVKNLIQDVGVESPIPLPNVSTHTLGQVLDYCKCYAENDHMKRNENLVEALEEDFNEWPGDAKLVELVDMENLYGLIMVCIEFWSLVEALEEDFNEWPGDAKLVNLVDMENLYGLIMAADYMHIESLLELICHTLARMIAKKTFGEIRQIFNFNNEFARAKRCLIGEESQLLASLMGALPTELQLKIKMKMGQRFHFGDWSPWRYDVEAQVLVVKLANLHDASINMHQQIDIILLYIEIGLVRILVLQTCGMMSVFCHPSGGICIEWVDPMDKDLFKDLFDGIDRSRDMLKIENVIFD